MNIKRKIGDFFKKYKHAWVFSYALLYGPWFYYLETHVTSGYHIIYSPIDDKIPFIEYFIVPYLLWFVFIAVVFAYFFFTVTQAALLFKKTECTLQLSFHLKCLFIKS